MAKQRIYSLKDGSLNENDRLEIARLLLKAGYAARLGREKPAGKSNGNYEYFIEFWEGEGYEEKQN